MSMTFKTVDEVSSQYGEYNDCAVRAAALTTGLPYSKVHAAMKARGRKNRRGTVKGIAWRAMEDLGATLETVPTPPGAKTVRTLPKAMKKAGLNTGAYLVYVAHHVFAYVDGQVEDWSKDTMKRIQLIKRVVMGPAPLALPAPKPPAPVGVRAGQTRSYLAGCLVRKHGIKAGVTPAMVAELDNLYGKANPTESTFCLKAAWHAARGYAGMGPEGT